MKKWLSILLVIILAATTAAAALPASAAETAGEPVELIEGTYAPNQVVVMFQNSAIDTDTEPDDDLAPVGADFGDLMDASSSEDEAYSAADEEIDILIKSLGSDFVLEDTLVFDDGGADDDLAPSGSSAGAADSDLTVALVSSEKYDTATLIKKLKVNKNVANVEPNYYIYPTSVEDYSLNDPLNSELYFVNSPLAKNNGGENVSSQGLDLDAAVSINASSGWAKLSGDEDEVVVAVVDTGVNYDHEDLKDKMWTNPGNIGLRGTYGYDFINNDDDPMDDNNHGTHCAGIITAQANNGKGIAGVASAANVKIMALKVFDQNGQNGVDDSTVFLTLGAFQYIHKAAQSGVNVVSVNNSWGSPGYSTTFDDLIDLLGEDGVVTYFAASNDGKDNDRTSSIPTNSESDYAVSVGAMNIAGARASFSNYGKTTVDVFGPGVAVLSSVSGDVYCPQLYDAETLNATTEYYGVFNADTQVIDGTITPSTGNSAGEDIKSFGSLQFAKRRILKDDDDYEIPDVARLELSVENDRLKIIVKDAQYGECYYVYFPYEKNPLTTGDDNTAFCLMAQGIYEEGNPGAYAFAGEVAKTETGCKFTLSDAFSAASGPDYQHERYVATNNGIKALLSAEDAEGKELGFGMGIYADWKEGESHDISFYLDSIAISKPDYEIESGTSYDYLSGTSMATPAVCGAGAILASLYPRLDGESGADYAKRIRTKLLSCVRQTEQLSDLCSTGGYVDLSMLDEAQPAITDAICDLENETLTLFGENLYEGSAITYRRMAVDGAEDQPLPEDMTADFADDGSKIVIHNAKSLFSTYTAFTVTAKNGAKGTGKFFLVKGQNRLQVVQTYENYSSQLMIPYLLTDADGKNLYGYGKDYGEVYYYDGNQFNAYKSTYVVDAMRQYLVDNGADAYSVYNDYVVTRFFSDVPTCENGVIYHLIVNYIPEENETNGEEATQVTESTDSEESKEEIHYREETYLATFDLNGTDHRWHFRKISELPEGLRLEGISYSLVQGIYNGKFICIGDPGVKGSTDSALPMYSYDLLTDEWTREPDLPYVSENYDIVQSNGKLYVMFGFDPDRTLTNEERILSEVWCFDGEKWEQKRDDLKYVGRINDNDGLLFHSDAITPVKNGLIFFDASVDDGGNMFLYHTDTDEIEPLYYSAFDTLCDSFDQYNSCVATRDGIYFIYDNQKSDDYHRYWNLCLLPADSGLYEDPYEDDFILGDADGDGKVTILDATAIQKYLASIPVPVFNEEAADIDGDGKVTVLDATGIQKFLAGLPSPLDPEANKNDE